MEILIYTLLTLYTLFIIITSVGIYNSRRGIASNKISPFSIIVCSNKGDISVVLNSLQEIQHIEFELIVMDDRSVTPITIDTDQYNFPINLIRINSAEEGVSPKKTAVNMAVEASKYDKLITIDDDTFVDDNYLHEVSKIDTKINNYTVGLIRPYTVKENFFSNIAMLDFIGFNLISIGCIKIGTPIYSNANNQVFDKQAFLEIDPYADNMNTLSGDDTFLLQKMSLNSKTITSFYNPNFCTSTDVPYTLKSFALQRIRWVSKSHKVDDKMTLYISILLYLFNLVLFVVMFVSPLLFIKVFILKAMVDTAFIFPTLVKFNMVGKLKFFIITEFFQIVYLIILPILGMLKGNKKW